MNKMFINYLLKCMNKSKEQFKEQTITCGNCKHVKCMDYGKCSTGCKNKNMYKYEPEFEYHFPSGAIWSLATGEIIKESIHGEITKEQIDEFFKIAKEEGWY